eukprot:5853425-Pyramimonas_sp.AAC.1
MRGRSAPSGAADRPNTDITESLCVRCARQHYRYGFARSSLRGRRCRGIVSPRGESARASVRKCSHKCPK